MAFEPKKLEIVPKGLNLLAPGDQVAEGDCLELTGWWAGSVGRLQQARGWVNKSGLDVGEPIDSLAEAQGAIFYGGGGGLWRVPPGSNTGASVDNGYDGTPLGLCAYQNMLWVMNRNKQRRIDPATGTAYDWKVVDPPAAPAVSISGGGSLADGDHVYYASFIDIYGYESSPSPAAAVTAPSLGTAGVTSGTVSLTQGSADVTLNDATWPADIDQQWFLVPSEFPSIVPPAAAPYAISYVDATHGTLTDGAGNAATWAGATNAAASYEIYSSAGSSKATIQQPTIPGADAGVVASWNVYHQSPGTDGPYLVNTTPIPLATTSYVDYGDAASGQDDNALLANDVRMEADHDPPPAARVMAGQPYNGRLVVANSAEHPNRIWYTNSLEPSYFPGSGNPQAGNWVDIGNDTGDEVLNLSVRPGMLLVYRQRSIWRVVGDLGDASSTIAPLIPNMGIVGPRAVVATSNGDLAVVKQGLAFGIYRVTDWEQRISAKVEPIFTGLGSECYLAMNPAAAATCALGYQLGRLWFSYPDGTNTTPSRTLICDVEQDSFSIAVAGRWFSRAGGFGAFLHGSLFYLGAKAGKVYSLEDGPGDEDGGNVALAFQSRYDDCGNPDHEKTWADLVISHNTAGVNLTVKIKANKGADSFTLATITSTAMTRQVIPMLYPLGHANAGKPIESFNLAVRIEGTGAIAYPGAVIDGPVLLHYFLKPRKAMSWDSGPTDHGIAAVKVVDAVEVDMDAGQMTLFIQSDLPGGVMTERTFSGGGIAVPATNGRQVQRIVLPAPLTGRVYRYQLQASGAPPTPGLVYKVRVRALAVGMYVDGTVGDSWYTEPIAAGV